MPDFDEAELRRLISASEIGAVTLDTSIFDQHQNNLESSALLGLRQFHGTGTRFILSNVVHGEVRSHILANATDARAKFDTAVKGIRKAWGRNIGKDESHRLLGIEEEPRALADRSLSAFESVVRFELVGAQGLVAIDDLLRLYFHAEAPFSNREAKKNEFPDALALLTLEAWADREDTIILAVSRDRDWKKFAQSSRRIFCIEDLETALNFFNSADLFVAQRAIAQLNRNEADELRAEITSAIERFLETFEPDIRAWSAMEYELEYIECVLQEWNATDGDPKILEANGESILFSIVVQALVDFSASFNFSVRDGVDGDYVNMGSETSDREAKVDLPLLIRIGRNFGDEPEVQDVEVTSPKFSVDFYNIDPRWGDDD